jgi:UDP-N-acetylglucosamine acyltransferase
MVANLTVVCNMHISSGLLDQSLKELEETESEHIEVMQFVQCIRSAKTGIMRGPNEE